MKEYIVSLLNWLFGCRHKNLSRPFTVGGTKRWKNTAASVTGTYVVCLDCGREFPYDWSEMRVIFEVDSDPDLEEETSEL